MDSRERILGLSKLMADNGYDIPKTMENEAKELGLHKTQLRRPVLQGGTYESGLEEWDNTWVTYDPEFGVLEIDIDGYSVVITRGHNDLPLGFKQKGVEEHERFEGSFRVQVMEVGADVFEDGEIYTSVTMKQSEKRKGVWHERGIKECGYE